MGLIHDVLLSNYQFFFIVMDYFIVGIYHCLSILLLMGI